MSTDIREEIAGLLRDRAVERARNATTVGNFKPRDFQRVFTAVMNDPETGDAETGVFGLVEFRQYADDLIAAGFIREPSQ